MVIVLHELLFARGPLLKAISRNACTSRACVDTFQPRHFHLQVGVDPCIYCTCALLRGLFTQRSGGFPWTASQSPVVEGRIHCFSRFKDCGMRRIPSFTGSTACAASRIAADNQPSCGLLVPGYLVHFPAEVGQKLPDHLVLAEVNLWLGLATLSSFCASPGARLCVSRQPWATVPSAMLWSGSGFAGVATCAQQILHILPRWAFLVGLPR